MHADTATRQHWMSVLAHSQPAELAARLNALNITADYEVIRAAETGLVQIQARMGGTGERFFAGDATLTTADSEQQPSPHVFSLLARQGLAKFEEDSGAQPDDITRTPPVYPCSRSSRLQQLMRGDEGYLLALAYSTQRGYGRNHPFAGEIRSGYIDVSIVPEELGFAVNVGELLMTECEMVNGFIDPPGEPPHFTRGYGLVFGMSERKAMAMALVDRALQAPEYGEHATGPAQDEEFVLAHADNVEAAGFVSHLKLPHYVDFQAELELLKRLQQEQNHG